MAKLVVEPLPGESRKEAKKRAKQERNLRKLERARWDRIKKRTPGFDEDIDALVEEAVQKERRKHHRMPPPQLEAPPPEPAPEAWEQGGMIDGTYVRQSTVEIEKVEAHLDSLAEVTSQQAIARKYRDMFGEDLPIPEGYELVPERRVRRRGVPAPEEAASPSPSPEAVAAAYGEGAAPQPPPMPPAPAPESYTLPHLAQHPAPEPAVAPQLATVEEAALPATEVAAPAAPVEEAPATEVLVGAAAPEGVPAPAPAPEPAPVAAYAGPQVAGAPAVAGVAASQVAQPVATAAAPSAVPKPVEKPKYKVLDIRRFWKIGHNAAKRGGGFMKLILVLINLPLYIVLLPIQIVATIVYAVSSWYAGHAKEKAREREWAEQHPAEEGYYEEGYGEGYEEGYEQPYDAQGPEEGGYYDEGYAPEEDAYGY